MKKFDISEKLNLYIGRV